MVSASELIRPFESAGARLLDVQHKMSTTIILGSSNAQGNTKNSVDRVFSSGEVSLIDLSNHSFTEWDYGGQNLEDGFHSLASQLAQSADIVFATPVYWYSMSAQMKRFFDRFSDLITRRKGLGRSLAGRRTWLLATGSDSELPDGFTVPFQRTSDYFDMTFCGFLYTQVNGNNFAENITSQIEAFHTKFVEQGAAAPPDKLDCLV